MNRREEDWGSVLSKTNTKGEEMSTYLVGPARLKHTFHKRGDKTILTRFNPSGDKDELPVEEEYMLRAWDAIGISYTKVSEVKRNV